MQGMRCRLRGAECGVQGTGCGVQGVGCWGWDATGGGGALHDQHAVEAESCREESRPGPAYSPLFQPSNSRSGESPLRRNFENWEISGDGYESCLDEMGHGPGVVAPSPSSNPTFEYT